MPNIELLQKTLAHIEAHPETWDQELWVNDCGTTACFAGHAVQLAGYELISYTDYLSSEIEFTDYVEMDSLPEDITAQLNNDYPRVHVQDVARIVLGLSPGQAANLFRTFNTMPDLRRLVAELCAGGPAEDLL
jgi:hypothetical protein